MLSSDNVAQQPFHADYPMWAVHSEALGKGKTGFVRLNVPGGEFLPLFTDVDLANRIIKQARQRTPNDFKPVALLSPTDLLAVVEHFKQNGIAHVGIDFSPPTVVLVPIDEYMDDVRRGDGSTQS